MFSGSITIKLAGGTPTIGVNELTNAIYPVHNFTWHTPTRGDSPPNLQAPGGHFHYAYVDPMAINMEGHILSDSTTAYWTARKNLLACVLPDVTQIYRYHSTIQMQLDGDSELYTANVILKDWDIPLEALYPTVTPFQFQWEAPVGYWLAASTFQAAKI